METKTKSGRDNTWAGFCIFREPDSSSIQPHIENLFHVKISISSYLSDICCEKWKKKMFIELGNFVGPDWFGEGMKVIIIHLITSDQEDLVSDLGHLH